MKYENIVSTEAIQRMCSYLVQVIQQGEMLDDMNVATDKTYSSYQIKELVKQCLNEGKSYTETLCNALTKLTCQKTTVQPTLDNSELNVIYLYSVDGNAPFEQFLKISDTELIPMGSTEVSMNNYPTKEEVANGYVDQVTYNGAVEKINTHTNDIVAHMTQAEKDSIVAKDSITTSITDASTDEEVPSAKAVYNTIDRNIYHQLNHVDSVNQGDRVIGTGTDLNTIVVAGTYRCLSSTICNSLVNCPITGRAFELVVNEGAGDYLKQEITVSNAVAHVPYFRIKNSVDVWGDWQTVLVKAREIPTVTTPTYGATSTLMVWDSPSSLTGILALDLQIGDGKRKRLQFTGNQSDETILYTYYNPDTNVWTTQGYLYYTKVRNVKKTAITLTDSTCVTIFDSVFHYEVKAGMCTVNFQFQTVATSTGWTTIASGLPRPNTTSYANVVDRNLNGGIGIVQITVAGGIRILHNGGNGALFYGTVTYPVVE